MPVQIDEVTFGSDGELEVDAQDSNYTLLVVSILSPEVLEPPSSIAVSVSDALSEDDLIFKIDGIEVFRHEADPDGSLDIVSVPVPNLKVGGVEIMQPGEHILVVTQGSSSIGQDTFTIINGPTGRAELPAADAPPASVPGAIQPNGTRRWVFQDLMPGGLGSWVLPMNPQTSVPPIRRDLTALSTVEDVSTGGQFHVYESNEPVEWEVEGICPSEAMRDQLEAYADLDRRWYVHDHRGRAWKVTVADLDLVPQLTKNWNGELTDDYFTYKFVFKADPSWTVVSDG